MNETDRMDDKMMNESTNDELLTNWQTGKKHSASPSPHPILIRVKAPDTD